MNRVDLVGRLTRDPELRRTSSGRAVTQINLAINRTFSNQSGEREADFINVVIWDKQAENVCKYMSKGRLVSVEGRIQTRNYDDKDGKRVYVTEVVANSVQFLSSGSGNNTSNNSFPSENPFDYDNSNSSNTSSTKDFNSSEPFANFGDSTTIDDDDLPF